jgi:hypothetical protein
MGLHTAEVTDVAEKWPAIEDFFYGKGVQWDQMILFTLLYIILILLPVYVGLTLYYYTFNHQYIYGCYRVYIYQV